MLPGRRSPFLVRLVSGVVASALVVVSRAAPVAPRPFPDTSDGIFVFHDQLAVSRMSDAQVQFAATHYVGTQKIVRDGARRLRAYNPGFLVLHYRLGQALGHGQASPSCTPVGRLGVIVGGTTWVPEWPGDQVVQEAWFFHHNGRRVFNCTWGHYLMELNDPGWRLWWSSQVIQQLEATEADGVFADSYSIPNYFGHCVFRPCLPDVDPAFEAQWASRERDFSDYMRSRLAGRWKWLPNVGAYITSRDPSDYSNADGVMIEAFSEWGRGRYFDPGDWVLQMNRSLALVGAGRILIAQADPAPGDFGERLFALASYLLIKGTRTYVNLHVDLQPNWFPEYDIDLGRPIDPVPSTIAALRNPRWDVYARRYANGLVLVNPSSNSRSVVLDRPRHLLSGSGGGVVRRDGRPTGTLVSTAVSHVTLAGHRAAVLLDAPLQDGR